MGLLLILRVLRLRTRGITSHSILVGGFVPLFVVLRLVALLPAYRLLIAVLVLRIRCGLVGLILLVGHRCVVVCFLCRQARLTDLPLAR